MTAGYQPMLVIISILIAMLASYTALGLGGRVINAEAKLVRYWIGGGALALGIGIWAMHFVGMLAFHLEIPLAYDSALTALSLVPAIGASAIALYVLRKRHRHSLPFYMAALLMGCGIAAMHYTGMAAMRMFPAIVYDPVLVVLSVVIAIVASGVAMELVYRLTARATVSNYLWQGAAAAVMGCAIAGMHYTGMAAASFPQDAVCLATQKGISGPVLTVLVIGGGVLVLMIAMAAIILDKLRDQNAFYSTLLKAQSDVGEGVMILEREQVVFANEAMSKMARMSIGDLLAMPSVCALFQGNEQDKIRNRLCAQIDRDEGIKRFELHLSGARDDDGHLELSMANFQHKGRIRTLMVCMDISDRKRTHDALHASEEKLRAMFDFSPLGITLSPLGGRFVEANPALEQMSGYRCDELAKLDFYDLVVNQHRREVDKLFETVQANGRFGPVEVELQGRGGDRLPVALNGVLVTGGDGAQYIWSTVEDITERVRAAEKLRQLNETLEERVGQRTQEVENQRHFIEAVLDTAGALVMLLDRDGRIVRFNKACEELSGYSFAELRGVPFWSKLFPTARVDSARSEFDRLIKTAETSRYENEWLTRAGETRLIAWSNAVLLGQNGRVQHVIATGIDVTERKRAERALKQANKSLQETVTSLTETQDKLVQAEKMASLGGLVAGISHEINTPLGIGVTSATNIREEVAQLQEAFNNNSMKRSTLEGFVKHVDQASEILLQNLRRASELITSFKQVAVDQSSDDWRWLNLHDYVDEIILSLKPKWKQTQVKLLNECDPQLSIYTHPGALYQVLSNFIINSLLHGFDVEQPGLIRISGHAIGGSLELVYSDDGKGVPEEIQGQIFDPFFTTQRGTGGSGLGLHIVYNLVSGTLGGNIDMSSNPGQGVRFRMEIPLSSKEQRA